MPEREFQASINRFAISCAFLRNISSPAKSYALSNSPETLHNDARELQSLSAFPRPCSFHRGQTLAIALRTLPYRHSNFTNKQHFVPEQLDPTVKYRTRQSATTWCTEVASIIPAFMQWWTHRRDWQVATVTSQAGLRKRNSDLTGGIERRWAHSSNTARAFTQTNKRGKHFQIGSLCPCNANS